MLNRDPAAATAAEPLAAAPAGVVEGEPGREAALRAAKVLRRPRLVAEPLPSAQLPLWADKVRGLPNSIARSSLFTVGNQNEKRQFFQTHKKIVSLNGYTITYKGEELRQSDEDVFLQLAHMARRQIIGERVEFTAFGLLKDLGWSHSRDGYKRLRETLDRLQGTGLRISSDGGTGGGYQGALIRKFAWKDDADNPLAAWVVWLEPEIVNLFGPSSYTQLWWPQRQSLRSALAKYLHSYFATHEHPYPMRVELLKSLTGSRVTRLGDFRKALRIALDQLVNVGFLDKWEIDRGDLVHVVRSAKAKRMLAAAAEAH